TRPAASVARKQRQPQDRASGQPGPLVPERLERDGAADACRRCCRGRARGGQPSVAGAVQCGRPKQQGGNRLPRARSSQRHAADVAHKQSARPQPPGNRGRGRGRAH
ncbi:hypothetical protein IWW52_006567, partial [Coemansia sp. RSA 2704]